MIPKFTLAISEEEKQYLSTLMLESIKHGLMQKQFVPSPPDFSSSLLQLPVGVFVTLKKDEQLRGCIGQVFADDPLYKTIAEKTHAAAFEDTRFKPLKTKELIGLQAEVSILSPIQLCVNLAQIQVGRHGLLITQGLKGGLLLPQVASERNWSREEFLMQLCHKAGLPADTWQDPDAQIYWFEATVFGVPLL